MKDRGRIDHVSYDILQSYFTKHQWKIAGHALEGLRMLVAINREPKLVKVWQSIFPRPRQLTSA